MPDGSVLAVQLKAIRLVLLAVAVTLVGTVGGVVSGGDGVVTVAVLLCSDGLLAASKATMLYEYVVLEVAVVSV